MPARGQPRQRRQCILCGKFKTQTNRVRAEYRGKPLRALAHNFVCAPHVARTLEAAFRRRAANNEMIPADARICVACGDSHATCVPRLQHHCRDENVRAASRRAVLLANALREEEAFELTKRAKLELREWDAVGSTSGPVEAKVGSWWSNVRHYRDGARLKALDVYAETHADVKEAIAVLFSRMPVRGVEEDARRVVLLAKALRDAHKAFKLSNRAKLELLDWDAVGATSEPVEAKVGSWWKDVRRYRDGARFEALQTFAATRDDVLHAIDALLSRTNA